MEGIELTCPDGKVRRGYPVLAAWLGDYPEYIKLFTASYMSCPTCEAPKDMMDAHSTTPISHRDVSFEVLSEKLEAFKSAEKVKAAEKRTSPAYQQAVQDLDALQGWFDQKRMRVAENRLWSIPYCSPTALWKPDLLHTMDLGMVKHALDWMFNMLDELSKDRGTLYDVA